VRLRIRLLLGAPLLVQLLVLSRVLQSGQHRDMRERVLQLVRVRAWSQAAQWEQGMLELLVVRCKRDTTPFMLSV
jgi:hypothetical protein